MKTKTEKHTFTFTQETSDFLKKISKETDLKLTTIVQRGIEMFAKEKGVKSEG